jgi:hypothetical protein
MCKHLRAATHNSLTRPFFDGVMGVCLVRALKKRKEKTTQAEKHSLY